LGIQASSEEVANSSEPHATETSGGWMDFIKTQVAQVGSTVVSAGSAVTSGIAGMSTSCTIVYASNINFLQMLPLQLQMEHEMRHLMQRVCQLMPKMSPLSKLVICFPVVFFTSFSSFLFDKV
jgi:hypothetical protein